MYSHVFSFHIFLCTIFHMIGNVSLTIQYRAPASCDWTLLNSNEVSVTCGIQTIVGTGVLATNFSLIQTDYTSSLSINCDPVFFESSLAPGSFSHLQELKSLYITQCKLREIPQESFRGLTELRNLTIRTFNSDWGAFHLELRRGSFSDLGQVEILDLGFNKIRKFSHQILCDLTSLKVLNLTNNDLREVMHYGEQNRSQGLCITGLIELDVSYNKIINIDRSSLERFRSLRSFKACESGLQTIEATALMGYEKLQLLDLSSNNLTSLPSKLFLDCHDLRELYLQNNSISTLPLGQFSNLQQLLVLNLSSNELTSDYVNAATFVSLIRLVILDLSHNQLHFLNGSTFQAQYSLQMLYLAHNDIVIIADNTFSSLYNLHTLDLSYNNIKILDIYTLNGLYVMSVLQLAYNNLYSIHPEAFKNCSSVQDLSLQGNKLSHVPSAVRSLQFLKSLDLSNNTIYNLANSTLRDLRQLQTLNLSFNKIGNITRGAFLHMFPLISLDLSKNHIQSIQHGVFDDTPSLRELNLSENELADINGLFMNLKALKLLNISYNKITWFDYALIPIDLEELIMRSNDVKVLGNYYELEASMQLKYLDASFNKIREISDSSLPNSINLVNISNNDIELIADFAFFSKTKISQVDLSNNNLRTLDINTFRLSSQAVANASEFYISGNPLFCDCNMEWLQKMNVLQKTSAHPRIADFNEVMCQITFTRYGVNIPLSEANAADFLCQYRSHCFALCHCCDFDACDCEMVCPENCTCYSDQTWNTNIVDCSNREYSSMPPTIPMDVTDLYLDGNNIFHLTSHTFIGRKNMRTIYLNNSEIHSIYNRTFNGLSSLNILHLENNKLSALLGFEFESLIHLKELYLSYNRISFVMNTTFQNLRSLEVLHLDHNLITEFHVWNLRWNSRLMHAQLGHNPWTCNCGYMRSYLEWLQSSSSIVHDIESVQCRYNQSIGPYVLEFDVATCSNKSVTIFQAVLRENYMTYVITVPLIVLLLIILIVLGYVYQEDFKVWLFSKYGIKPFHRSEYKGNSEKLFDAFISYTKREEDFISQTFVPEMEYGTPSYRMCLKNRDIPLCNFVADAIAEAIECSHRTIIFLSEQFLKNDWCRFELKSAHRESLGNSRHKIIVVVLDNMSLKTLDENTKFYIKNSPVIRFGDKRFWDKVKYSMPKGQRHRTIDSNITFPRQNASRLNTVRLV